VCEHVFVPAASAADDPVASILHADLDAFFASVEQRDDPKLRGRPVIVGGGVVMAASYEARAFGVRGAMGGRQARQLCPQAVVVPPRMAAYSQASEAVFAVFRATTPIVEGVSIDEAFLDVGGLRRVSGPAEAIAEQLRRDVLERVGLHITVGGARTKFLAKVASRVAKPDGLLIVPPAHELEFLHALTVDRLWGVGPATARKLQERGITSVGEVAGLGEETLVAMLGPASGHHLHALAHNRDPRPVQPGRRRRSMGAQRALGRGRRPAREVSAMLDELVDGVARRLREARVVGHTVVLRLRFDDFTRVTRSSTLALPTAETQPLRAALQRLLADARPTIDARGLTLVGMAVANLTDADAVQLRLPFDGGAGVAIDHALDAVRGRFGGSSIGRAALLGRARGWSMPVLPYDGDPSSS
jgi:DNA polymerase IV